MTSRQRKAVGGCDATDNRVKNDVCVAKQKEASPSSDRCAMGRVHDSFGPPPHPRRRPTAHPTPLESLLLSRLTPEGRRLAGLEVCLDTRHDRSIREW